jgi:O-antigen/teichoic acid export membrane protein
MTTHPARRVFLNMAALLAAYVLPRSLTLAAALIAARVLQPAAFGAYGFAAALAFSLSILATLGMLPLLVREIARAPERADELVGAAHRIKLLLSLPMLAGIALCARMLSLPANVVAAALLLGCGHTAWALAENFGARLQAEERMRPWLHANLVFGVVSGSLAALAVVLTRSVPWFCAGFAGGQLAALAYLVARQPRAQVAGSAADWRRSIRPLARATLPFAVAFFALTVFYKADVLLLGRLRDAHEAGIYAAGYKLVDIVHALAVVAAAAVYPRLARASAELAGRRVLELFLMAAAAGAGCMWLLRAPLIDALYGADYHATIPALTWLAPAAGILALNIFSGYVLALTDRVRLLAAAYAAGLVVKFALGMMLMPAGGAAGAAAAMFASEAMLACGMLLALRDARVPLPRRRPVLLGAGTIGIAVACDAAFAPMIAAIVFVAAIALLYGAAGALTVAERGAIREAVRPMRMTAGTT